MIQCGVTSARNAVFIAIRKSAAETGFADVPNARIVRSTHVDHDLLAMHGLGERRERLQFCIPKPLQVVARHGPVLTRLVDATSAAARHPNCVPRLHDLPQQLTTLRHQDLCVCRFEWLAVSDACKDLAKFRDRHFDRCQNRDGLCVNTLIDPHAPTALQEPSTYRDAPEELR